MKVLVLNSGSSSLKACLYEIGKTLPIHEQFVLVIHEIVGHYSQHTHTSRLVNLGKCRRAISTSIQLVSIHCS
jgi:acetate kinase